MDNADKISWKSKDNGGTIMNQRAVCELSVINSQNLAEMSSSILKGNSVISQECHLNIG